MVMSQRPNIIQSDTGLRNQTIATFRTCSMTGPIPYSDWIQSKSMILAAMLHVGKVAIVWFLSPVSD